MNRQRLLPFLALCVLLGQLAAALAHTHCGALGAGGRPHLHIHGGAHAEPHHHHGSGEHCHYHDADGGHDQRGDDRQADGGAPTTHDDDLIAIDFMAAANVGALARGAGTDFAPAPAFLAAPRLDDLNDAGHRPPQWRDPPLAMVDRPPRVLFGIYLL